ncbi:MAG: NUDIX domain-containing protein [Candidatus Doudnabacteria bacterium]|nr:NUDIX domain-containing protein [Candidatus Doudnabacteria bacterium]
MPEIIDWIDESDQKLGEVDLDKAHNEALLHRLVVIYVLNTKGEILVQVRPSGRLDHSSAGHLGLNEDYDVAASRELCEELGICDAKLEEIGRGTYDGIEPEVEEKRIRHLYRLYQCKAKPRQLRKGEVKSAYWADPLKVWEEMKRDRENLKYCGNFKHSLELFLHPR